MTFTTNTVKSEKNPTFRFKVRWNPELISWEVWSFLAGRSDRAKWFLISKNDAIWYQLEKNASHVSFDGETILLGDIQ